jgi:multiple sugar transport system ATP-binding protein
MPKLVVKNLRKLFGTFEAVKDVGFQVEEKETLCLLGPSGCGKTTILRIIAGLEMPTSGEVFVDGVLVNDVPPQKRQIGLVFQDYAIFPHLSVFENIAYGLRVRKMPEGQLRKKVHEAASLIGVGNILDVPGKKLGLSEMQRVAIGRSIVLDPKLLLLDEPLSNIDAKARERMRAELGKLQKEIGIATVYVTHDQLEALTLADRIAVMRNGLIEQIGTTSEIYDNPRTLFVANFIGSPSMNLIDCELVYNKERAILKSGDFALDITEFAEAVRSKSTGRDLILGIRPENVSLDVRKTDRAAMESEVQLVEPIGAKSIYHLRIGRLAVLAKGYAMPEVNVGSKVWATFNKDKLHVFDLKTEETIV